MNFEESTTKIILAVIAFLTFLVSGAIISIKKSKKRSSKNTISNISINGDDNKIVGGDDNSNNS